MLKTNYAEIAPKYDRTRAGRQIDKDTVLSAKLESAGSRPVRALDIGCGTGNYLRAQSSAFDTTVRWYGVDLSEDMLAVARGKLPGSINLSRGTVEELPFPAATFDFVSLSAAFHHFPDKERALDEIVRVACPGASIHLRNGAYEYRPKFWVYRFFPETLRIDQGRFWDVDRLIDGFEARGARTNATVTCFKYRESKSELILWAENRDLSQLALLSEKDYQAGLQALRSTPGDEVRTEYATVDISAMVA